MDVKVGEGEGGGRGGSGHGTLKIIVGHHRGQQETFSNSRRSTIAKTITF